MSYKKGCRSPALGVERTVLKVRDKSWERLVCCSRIILEQEGGLENRSLVPRQTFQLPDHIITWNTNFLRERVALDNFQSPASTKALW